jgi:anti-anti-sigma regulatory factor
MIKIQKEFQDECIIYNFTESDETNDLDRITEIIEEDSDRAYAFILNFEYIKQLNLKTVTALNELYVDCVKNACEMIICGLNTQPALMMEILRTNKLYRVESTLQAALQTFKEGNTNAFYSN